MTPHDHDMIQLAKRRGQVAVALPDRTVTATLVAWRPRRNGDISRRAVARVMLDGGRTRTVALAAVSTLTALQEIDAHLGAGSMIAQPEAQP